jgi:hypothetical protein
MKVRNLKLIYFLAVLLSTVPDGFEWLLSHTPSNAVVIVELSKFSRIIPRKVLWRLRIEPGPAR